MQWFFTVNACIAGWTLACIAALTRIKTRSSVLARQMIGTKIKILITEEATPAFVTQTIPLFDAGTVQASWIALTFVA